MRLVPLLWPTPPSIGSTLAPTDAMCSDWSDTRGAHVARVMKADAAKARHSTMELADAIVAEMAVSGGGKVVGNPPDIGDSPKGSKQDP